MAAWQYFAGAGLVAVFCPLHGQVAVADDGGGSGARAAEARVDACVPERPPRAPSAQSPAARPPAGRPPALRPSAARPPVVPPPAVRPPEVRPPEPPGGRVPLAVSGVAGVVRPTVHHPGRGPAPAAVPEPLAGGPPTVAPVASPAAKALPAEPPAAAPDTARVTAFHVRPYRSRALDRREPGGLSTVMLMAVVTTPAVLAAAALRPRSKSRT
ncbi:hypothetical protein ACFV7Q_22655 [Streptomyces sp. NPDC059851]|uniref:hypothetical protein n=1 Tax=Streptomyces sp. NPDC059851 TaxID=3346971 RepID=UPI003662A407